MRSYYVNLKKYLEETGAKSIGIIYTEMTPTLQNIGKETLPAMAEELGIEVTTSIGTPATVQDFAAPISQVLDTDPDIVSILLVGASNPTAMTQLRQAGYDGPVLGNSGASAGNLEPAGEAGNGMVWAADFNFQQSAASSQEFVTKYTDEFGEDPLNYAAEAYDAAWFLAKSLKESGSADRRVHQGRDGDRGRRAVRRRAGRGPADGRPDRRGARRRHRVQHRRREAPLRGRWRLTPLGAR